jgi:hypothetical protein
VLYAAWPVRAYLAFAGFFLAVFSSDFIRWISTVGTARTRPTSASNLANSFDGRGSDFMRLGYSTVEKREEPHMEVDAEFLRVYVFMIDSFLTAARDKMIFKKLLISAVGDDWRGQFERAQSNPAFLGADEVELAELREMRKVGVAMMEALHKGEPLPKPHRSVN